MGASLTEVLNVTKQRSDWVELEQWLLKPVHTELIAVSSFGLGDAVSQQHDSITDGQGQGDYVVLRKLE